MKHRTPQRAALDAAASEWRDAFKRTVELCELCEKLGNAVHEIPRANLRKYVYTNPSCILLLCDPGCHQVVGNWAKAKQAALLRLRRPDDYDLAVLNRWLVARVSEADVDAAEAELISELVHGDF